MPLRSRFAAHDVGAPITLDLELTDVCTHRCPWCLYPRTPQHLPLAAAHAAFEGAVALGTDSVIVTGGGEPLLHPQADEIIALGPRYGIPVGLFTHGELLGQFEDVVATSCTYVRLSIDAGTARTYARLHGCHERAFDELLRSIARIAGRPRPPLLGGSAVVTNANVDEIGVLAERLAVVGGAFLLLKFDVRRSAEWNGALATRLQPQLERARRALGAEAVDVEDPTQIFRAVPLGLASAKSTVQPDGGLYPCCHRRDPEWRIADLSASALSKVWGGPRHRAILERYRKDVHPCRLMRYWINRPVAEDAPAPERAGLFL